MNSGGKDSMASTIICYENGIKLDGVVIAEVMFSHARNISGEHPKHIEWLYNIAIPKIENDFGYKVIIVKSKKDYIAEFNGRFTRSKHPERNGKKHGFVLGGNRCALKRDCKIRPLSAWCKQQGEFEQILGIAADETERLKSMHLEKNKRSVLEEFGITEAMTYEIDRKYGLLSPFYDTGRKRQGCWFCPNCSIGEFAEFKREYPELWDELRIMSQDPEICSPCFKYNKTFHDVEQDIEKWFKKNSCTF